MYYLKLSDFSISIEFEDYPENVGAVSQRFDVNVKKTSLEFRALEIEDSEDFPMPQNVYMYTYTYTCTNIHIYC